MAKIKKIENSTATTGGALKWLGSLAGSLICQCASAMAAMAGLLWLQTVVRRRVDLIDGGEDDIAVRAELLAGEGEARAADGDGAQDEASVDGIGAQCFRTATCAAADRLRTRICARTLRQICTCTKNNRNNTHPPEASKALVRGRL